jgi:hypothetical protein
MVCQKRLNLELETNAKAYNGAEKQALDVKTDWNNKPHGSPTTVLLLTLRIQCRGSYYFLVNCRELARFGQ